MRQRSPARLPAKSGGLRALTVAALAALLPTPLFAQTAERFDAGADADDARSDALLGTLNLETPAPLDNLYATTPGLEQRVRRARFRFNVIAPLSFTSNAEEIASGGTQTLGASPFGNLSWAAPVANLPLRVTLGARSEFNRYFEAPNAEVDRFTVSGRLQYVDPGDDQAFSPYFAIVPRADYAPLFAERVSERQDFNLGINKRFNFDADFQPIPIASDTSEATLWSFGLTAFAQRRLRQPQASSYALFLIPSASWIISQDWNASFAVEMLSRWLEPNLSGQSRTDWQVMPIATLEYVIPARFFGSDRLTSILGRPSIDVQTSYQKVWSTIPTASYGQWQAQAALKMGWRF
jgi:hypothetical protein